MSDKMKRDIYNFFIQYLKEKVKNYTPPQQTLTNYHAYEFSVVEIAKQYNASTQKSNDSNQASPHFMDVAWDMARRGLIRPSRRYGSSRDLSFVSDIHFSFTELGAQWLKSDEERFYFGSKSHYVGTIEPFKDKLGSVFFERAQEAAGCYDFNLYIATCIMAGVAAEAIFTSLLAVKLEDEKKVKKIMSHQWRKEAIEKITENLADKEKIGKRLTVHVNKLADWRNEGAHGDEVYLESFHAYDSLSSLLSLAKFCFECFEHLTRPVTT